ncbi:MAG: DUF3352 domain-containing protein [Gaiellaceae bacterium]
MSRVALACFLAGALALPAAGCGSSSSTGAAGAAIAPAGTQVFISIDTTFDSSNWEAGRSLLAKFPDGDGALSRLLEQLTSQGVDFERDVRPALGPETDLVALDLSGSGAIVGLTQPQDREKLAALLRKADASLVTREVAGWTVFADSDANLDEFEQMRKEGTLDSGAYRDISGAVAEDGLVHVYVAGEALQATPLRGVFGADAPALAFSLKPEGGGVRLEGAAKPVSSDLFSDEFKAALPAEVPRGVFAYVGASNVERQLSALRDVLAEAAPGLERVLERAEAELGVSLEEDVFPLFAEESALYVRPGFPIPEVTLVTQVDDEQGAVETLDKLGVGLAEYFAGAEPTSVDVAGVNAKQVAINDFVSLYYAAFDGNLVLTTSRQGIAALRSENGRLADSEAFKEALSEAGTPDETTGFVYVNLTEALPAVLGLLGAGGLDVPAWVSANLEPLQSLVLWGERDGDLATFTGFLSIQ